MIYAPTLNPEIKAALSELLVKKDKAIENKQKQLAAAISCLAEALTRSFSLEHKDSIVIKLMIEAGRLMCDTQHTESMTRRSFICSSIKKDVKDQLYETEIDAFLFGEKLAETLKTAKAINKSGLEIKINQSAKAPTKGRTSRGLNFKAPLPNSRQPAVAANRRQEPAQAAATPTRRQQGPPGPPPQPQQQQPLQQRSRNRAQTRQ
uniref:Uncharacterized protein n=2 Tax=Pectinophora gossypiella TaxID=13191 RepID=A0A1E1W2B2_PECGO